MLMVSLVSMFSFSDIIINIVRGIACVNGVNGANNITPVNYVYLVHIITPGSLDYQSRGGRPVR